MSWIYLLDISLTSSHLLTTWKRGAGTRKWTVGKTANTETQGTLSLALFPSPARPYSSFSSEACSQLALLFCSPSWSLRLAAEERNPVRFNAVLTGFRLHTSQTQGSLLGLLFPSLWLTVEPRPFLWEDNHLLLMGYHLKLEHYPRPKVSHWSLAPSRWWPWS